MLPLNEIPDSLISNKHLFEDVFFKSYPLRPAPQDLTLPDGRRRNYQFPTYFDKVQFSAGVFLCDYEQAVKHMPSSDITPVSALGKRAMLIVASYQYRNIHQMKGYNEVLVMIPVMHKGLRIPLLPPLIPGYPGAGYYIIALPMASLENMLRGQQFWGLPKAMHEVDIEADGHHCVTNIKSEDEQDFVMRIPRQGKTKKTNRKSRVFSIKDNKQIQFATHFKGDCQYTTNWNVLFRPNKADSNLGCLELGDSPLAETLKALKINPVPFQTTYCNDLKSCLFLPD
ncbi:MAG: acetoacetate decarboxylase family protein [Bermanella sp.]